MEQPTDATTGIAMKSHLFIYILNKNKHKKKQATQNRCEQIVQSRDEWCKTVITRTNKTEINLGIYDCL